MYENIKGSLEVKGLGYVVIGGKDFDYKVHCSEQLIRHMENYGEDYRIPVYLKHDEKGMLLYGFVDKAEKDMFLKLIKVGGIGCNKALDVLSSVTPPMLRQYVLAENIRGLSSANGIGDKTALKIIKYLKV